MLEGSEEYAVELEADIKERAYDVVELLCHGFAAAVIPPGAQSVEYAGFTMMCRWVNSTNSLVHDTALYH